MNIAQLQQRINQLESRLRDINYRWNQNIQRAIELRQHIDRLNYLSKDNVTRRSIDDHQRSLSAVETETERLASLQLETSNEIARVREDLRAAQAAGPRFR